MRRYLYDDFGKKLGDYNRVLDSIMNDCLVRTLHFILMGGGMTMSPVIGYTLYFYDYATAEYVGMGTLAYFDKAVAIWCELDTPLTNESVREIITALVAYSAARRRARFVEKQTFVCVQKPLDSSNRKMLSACNFERTRPWKVGYSRYLSQTSAFIPQIDEDEDELIEEYFDATNRLTVRYAKMSVTSEVIDNVVQGKQTDLPLASAALTNGAVNIGTLLILNDEKDRAAVRVLSTENDAVHFEYVCAV